MSVLARRIAAQGLASRSATTLDVLRSWTVQDSPPGAAATAIAARANGSSTVASPMPSTAARRASGMLLTVRLPSTAISNQRPLRGPLRCANSQR